MPDDYAGGRAAAQELLDAGHRRIAYIDDGDDDRPIAAQLRLQGYIDVLSEAGITPRSALHVYAPTSAAGGQRAVTELFALPGEQRPTGIFAFNDRIAAASSCGRTVTASGFPKTCRSSATTTSSWSRPSSIPR